MFFDHVLLHEDERRNGGSRAGAWQSEKTEMTLLAMLVADIESRETDGGAAHVERADRPDEPADDRRAVECCVAVKQLQGDERRGAAEADDVGQAVELPAEVGGMPGEAGEAAVDGVEEHRDEDQVGRSKKSIAVEPLRPVVGAAGIETGDIHRAESADGIAQRREAGKRIDRADICPAAVPADAPPPGFAGIFIRSRRRKRRR